MKLKWLMKGEMFQTQTGEKDCHRLLKNQPKLLRQENELNNFVYDKEI